MAIEKKQFTGGLNSDIEDRLLPNGDYRFALNIRASKSDGSSEGAIENTKGNSVLSIKMPNGTNRVIGALDNVKENTVIYFVFNSLSNHVIYEFDANNSSISILLQTPLLKFQSTGFINDPFVISDILFFNDRINPPRSLNITRAKSNGYPLPFEERYINVIVNAPGCPPVIEFGDDSTISVNSVRGKLFQFRYKYVYLDNEESAWSPISKVALPINESNFRPFSYYPLTLNNVINVEVVLGDDYVKRIKISAREGNTGDFFLAADLDKSKLNLPTTSVPLNYIYDFYNNETYTSIDNDGNSGMRLFDNVPQLSDAQSPIDGNKVSYGGITENYDPVDIDIDVKVNLETSIKSPPPLIEYAINNQRHDGFGIVIGQNHLVPSNNGRIIGGVNYRLISVQKQLYRPSPVSSSLIILNGTLIPQVGYVGSIFNSSFAQGIVRDRSLIIENTLTGATINCGGSTFSEVFIEDPSSAGIRYVLNIVIRYYDIGNSDALKSRWVKVQYTSVAGDTSITVATELKNLLVGVGTISENKVDIKVDQSVVRTTGSWSFGISAPIPTGKTLLRIWGEAYVPGSKKDADPSPSWPTATGGDTGVLEFMSVKLDGYANWTLQNRKTLKSGATHAIGLVYYDDPNRSGLTNVPAISKEKTFYVPFFSEQNILPAENPNNTTLTVTINHLPPSWAKRYQIVYTGNQTIDFLPGASGYKGFIQFQLKDVGTSTVPGAIKATIVNLLNYNNNISEEVLLGYNFTSGDRIRFITNSSAYLQDYRDVEVISFDISTNTITFKDPGISVSNNFLVEIYTPKNKVDTITYFEIGECFDIINGFHRGNGGVNSNQDATSPAIIDLDDIGDVYLRFRTDPISSTIEDYAYSDYYPSDVWDKGRPNIVDNNIVRVKRISTVRFSNNYIPSTNINGLSQFDDFDFEEYDQQYGNIERLYGKDKDLLVFQTIKVGRIRIGQTTLFGNEGTNIATLKSQDKVLSDIVYYTGEYGIGINPESFSVYGNRIYFVDVKRGSVLRLSLDGITQISEYNMHNYFNDTFKELIDGGGNYKVFGVYDVRFDEYIISIQSDVEKIALTNPFGETPIIPTKSGVVEKSETVVSLDVSGTTIVEKLGLNIGETTTTPTEINDTIAFSEFKNRWVTYYSYVPDYMISNNIDVITFKNGELNIHNKNEAYNNFYGVSYDTLIQFLSNIDPSSIKIYNHIFLESTHIFSMPEATNEFGQKTSLIDADFVDREGVWKSEFLRDDNTPNIDNPLIEGDTIRCHSLKILLKNSDVIFVKMFSIGVGVELSELTNK